MFAQERKMSELMQDLAEAIFLDPDAKPSDAAACAALLFANLAWNECVGIGPPREACRPLVREFEAENPALWNELVANDLDELIDRLVDYKKTRYPNDQRRILLCGVLNGTIRVEWLPPAAPGVDSDLEMELHSLIRTGGHGEAIKFLRRTRELSVAAARKQVASIAAGMPKLPFGLEDFEPPAAAAKSSKRRPA